MFTGWVFMLAATGSEPGPWLEVVRERGAESCPDARGLSAAVEGQLGRPVTPAGAHVHCTVTVDREGRGWRARVAIEDGPRGASLRTIRAEGTDCRPLASALELTLTLALATQPVPAPAVVQVADDELPPGLEVGRRSEPAVGPWSASGGAVLSLGALLEVSTGLELGGRWRRGRLSLSIEGRAERTLPSRQGPATMEGWGGSGAVVPCWAPGALQICGVSRAGGFTVRGEGLPVSRSGRGLLAELGGRAVWRVGGDALGAALYLELAAPLVRTRLLVDARPSWSSPPVVASLGLAVVMGR